MTPRLASLAVSAALVCAVGCDVGPGDGAAACGASSLGGVYTTPFIADPGAGGGWYGVTDDGSDAPTVTGDGTSDGSGTGGSNDGTSGDGSGGDGSGGDGTAGDGSGGDGSGGDGADAFKPRHLGVARPLSIPNPGATTPDARGCYACTVVCRLDAPADGLTAGTATGYGTSSSDAACRSAIGAVARWAHDDAHRRLTACKSGDGSSDATPPAAGGRVPAVAQVNAHDPGRLSWSLNSNP